MAISPITGLPETPEEEQARLQAQFAPYQPATIPPALGGTVPTPAPPPLAAAPILATSLPPPPEPPGMPVAPENRASFAEPPPAAVTPPLVGNKPAGPTAHVPTGPAADLQNIQAETERVAGQKGDLGVQRAGLEQHVADQQVVQAQEVERRRAALEQTTSAEMAKRQQTLDVATEKYNAMGFKDFWSRATVAGKEGTNTGARILGAISMALGAAGAGLAHMPNYAMEMIDKAIDRDYQMQKDSILKARDTVEQARFGVDQARLSKADKLLDLENWRKSAYEQAGAQAKSMLAKMNVPEAEADKSALVVATRQKAFDSQQALTKGTAELSNIRAETSLKLAEATKARAEAGAKGTEGADDKGRAAGKQIEYATMASQMHDDINKLKRTGLPTPETLDRLQRNDSALKMISESHGVTGLAGTLMARKVHALPKGRFEGISSQQQEAVNSFELLAKKASTVLSGQGHANVEGTMSMMMLKPEDSPEVKAQKLQNLSHIADNAQVLSGKYGQRLDAADAARAPAPPAPPRQLDAVTKARLLERLQKFPNDPRAGEVRALLGM